MCIHVSARRVRMSAHRMRVSARSVCVHARVCVCPRACLCVSARAMREMRFTEKFNPTAILELLIGFSCFVYLYIYICFYEYVAMICSFPSYPIFTNTLWYKLTATITPPYFFVHDFQLR